MLAINVSGVQPPPPKRLMCAQRNAQKLIWVHMFAGAPLRSMLVLHSLPLPALHIKALCTSWDFIRLAARRPSSSCGTGEGAEGAGVEGGVGLNGWDGGWGVWWKMVEGGETL